MDPTSFKELPVPSGHTYRYLHRRPAPASGRPTLLFLHGFPSSSYGWRHQARHFGSKGYGLIVPDLLGYGGTSKPLDPREYVATKITRDIIAILDEEHVQTVVVVGHDLGSSIVSRFINYYPERCIAAAFIAVSYQAPGFVWDLEAIDAICAAHLGHEILGYWKFFRESDSTALMREREDAFYSLVYCADTRLWAKWLGPTGKLREWLAKDKRAPRPKWLSEKERTEHRSILAKSGWAAPKCWYSARYLGYTHDDEKHIPQAAWQIHCPVLYIGGSKDPICNSTAGIRDLEPYAADLTVSVMNAGHWIPEEKPEETNRVLETFMAEL